jgi:hypothetical protein
MDNKYLVNTNRKILKMGVERGVEHLETPNQLIKIKFIRFQVV